MKFDPPPANENADNRKMIALLKMAEFAPVDIAELTNWSETEVDKEIKGVAHRSCLTAYILDAAEKRLPPR